MKVVGVKFRKAGRVYYFDPLQFELPLGCNVIVETARGVELGTISMRVRDVNENMITPPLKPILRLATPEDLQIVSENEKKEKEAFKICLEKIAKHGLEMKLIDCEYTFDNNKLLYYFTADGRVDFRELVKDLASVFKTRIELRQIGVRDETKMLGGIGICGRPLCCHSYLNDFVPVSIKMAKEQNLSLNPTKISGVCGRLMCCLKNEEEAYEELNSHLPAIGDTVTTPEGLRGEVKSTSVLKQLVKVLISLDNDEKEMKEYKASELKFRPRKRNDNIKVDEGVLELEELEEEELREQKESKKNAQNRSNRGNGENHNNGENRGNRENRGNNGENRGNRENNGNNGENRGNRENNGNNGENRGNRENNGNNGENRGNRENNGNNRGNRENRFNRMNREGNGEERSNDAPESASEEHENGADNRPNHGNRNRRRHWENRENNGNNGENRGNRENNGNNRVQNQGKDSNSGRNQNPAQNQAQNQGQNRNPGQNRSQGQNPGQDRNPGQGQN